MNLTKNMKNNLNVLLSITLKAKCDDVQISKCSIIDDTFTLSFKRKITLSQLKRLNNYFGTDVRKKEIPYSLIVNKNSNIIKLHIEEIENYRLNMLDNYDDINSKIIEYDKKVSDKLIKFSNYLYETIYPTDNEVKEWTFYYISNNKKHIGFANKDYQSDNSIKIYTSDFKWFERDSFPSFYDNVDKLIGTANDANVICMRRNYNSKHGSNWKPCIYGTPIKELWTD